MNPTNGKKYEVLLVEDNGSDALLTKIAFRENRFYGNLSIVTDGEQALLFVNREDPYLHAPLPDLILLDLNLPRMDGRTFLRRLRAQEKFRDLKVVVLTSSKLDSDLREIKDLSANAYLVKPLDLYGFFRLVGDLTDFLKESKALPTQSV